MYLRNNRVREPRGFAGFGLDMSAILSGAKGGATSGTAKVTEPTPWYKTEMFEKVGTGLLDFGKTVYQSETEKKLVQSRLDAARKAAKAGQPAPTFAPQAPAQAGMGTGMMSWVLLGGAGIATVYLIMKKIK